MIWEDAADCPAYWIGARLEIQLYPGVQRPALIDTKQWYLVTVAPLSSLSGRDTLASVACACAYASSGEGTGGRPRPIALTTCCTRSRLLTISATHILIWVTRTSQCQSYVINSMISNIPQCGSGSACQRAQNNTANRQTMAVDIQS